MIAFYFNDCRIVKARDISIVDRLYCLLACCVRACVCACVCACGARRPKPSASAVS
jgi:hypothetical protein